MTTWCIVGAWAIALLVAVAYLMGQRNGTRRGRELERADADARACERFERAVESGEASDGTTI